MRLMMMLVALCHAPIAAQMTFFLVPQSIPGPHPGQGPFVFDSLAGMPLVVSSEPAFGYRPHYWSGTAWSIEAPYFPNGWGAFGGPHWVAFDRVRGKAVMLRFGQNGAERTLEWSVGIGWAVMSAAPAGFPPHAATASNQEWPLAYDPVRQQVVTVGSGPGIATLSVHAWDGVAWTAVPSANPPPTNGRAEVAYDEARSCLLVINRSSLTSTDAWELQGTTWTPIAPFPFGTDERADPVFDPVAGCIVCGGNGGWKWNGQVWAPARYIGARISSRYTVTTPISDMLVFGQYLFSPIRSPLAATTPFGVACPGPLGDPTIACDQPALGTRMFFSLENTLPLGLAWPYLMASFNNTTWGGASLPASLGGFGFPGCAMNISPDYLWPPGMSVGDINLPALPYLVGVHLFLQGFSLNLIGPNGPHLSATRGVDCLLGVIN